MLNFIGSSRSPDMPNGAPFGYLKASTKLLTVNLFVLPYNYPVLLPLLDDLFKLHRLRPTQEWRAQFHVYLRTMPAYYAAPLRRVLTRMGAGNLANSLIPETMDNCLSYSVLNYLKRLKNQAKLEFDKTLSNNSTAGSGKSSRSIDGMKVLVRSPMKRDLLMNHLIKDKFLGKFESLLNPKSLKYRMDKKFQGIYKTRQNWTTLIKKYYAKSTEISKSTKSKK